MDPARALPEGDAVPADGRFTDDDQEDDRDSAARGGGRGEVGVGVVEPDFGTSFVDDEGETDGNGDEFSDAVGDAGSEAKGRIRPPMSVVVPHSQSSNPSVIFLFAAESAASSTEPAPRTDFMLFVLSII